MSDKSLEKGDLVRINQDLSDWNHLSEKEENHCLKGHGIILEVRERKYIVKFGKWTAYLRESDLIKLTNGEER